MSPPLCLSLDAAKKAFPGRASVAVTGEAGFGYMLGNLEVLLRERLGITVVDSSNGGFAVWTRLLGARTRSLLTPGAGPDEVDMSKVIGALGFHTERVSEPAEFIPALRRALDVNKSGRPAYIEFILSSSAASTPSMASGLDGAQSETMPKLSGHLENAGTMCHDETQRTGGTP